MALAHILFHVKITILWQMKNVTYQTVFDSSRRETKTYSHSNSIPYNKDSTVACPYYRIHTYSQDRYSTPQFGVVSGPLAPLPYRVCTIETKSCYGSVRSTYYYGPDNQSNNVELLNGAMYNTGFDFTAQHLITAADVQAEIDNLRAKLDLKLLTKIKDERSNLANMFAERQQAIDQVVDTAKRLVNVLVNLKKGNWAAAAAEVFLNPAARKRGKFKKEYAKNQSKAIADAWIGMQYGWKPLVQGVRDAVQVLTEGRRPLEITVRGSETLSRQIFGQPTLAGKPGTAVTILNITLHGQVTFGVSGDVTKLSQLGLTNPLSPLWELTPWSFVVDWFLPVGKAISALDATVGMSFRRGCVSSKVELTTSASLSFNATSGYQTDTIDLTAISSKKEFTRSVLTDFPTVSFPRFKSPISADHIWNSLALATQRVK